MLTENNVIDGEFAYCNNVVEFRVELKVAFNLRHGDIVIIEEKYSLAATITDFNLNEDNTVTITAALP